MNRFELARYRISRRRADPRRTARRWCPCSLPTHRPCEVVPTSSSEVWKRTATPAIRALVTEYIDRARRWQRSR